MFKSRLVCALLSLCCVLAIAQGAAAAEVECDATYCFTYSDFAGEAEETLAGICVMDLPDADTGTVMLGARVLRPGDILTAQQLEQLTFMPLRTEQDQVAQLTYLPIYEGRVETAATVTISVWGKEDQSPVAQDMALETYKNLPNSASLKVKDPEGQTLTYTIVRQPRRGQVVIGEDGTFTYTPKKNKVGTDSFTYTATDPAGNVSREATVTIEILKPANATQYTDTEGLDCRFEAEWLKNTGIFEGEKLGGAECFFPDKTVTQGEFLTMVLKALEIPSDETVWSSVPQETPAWLKPYLAAAIRSGLTAGISDEFSANEPVTGAMAAVMLQNVLDLTVSAGADLTENPGDIPAWAVSAVNAMADNGIVLDSAALTRAEAAKLLYRISALAQNAPGMAVYRQ